MFQLCGNMKTMMTDLSRDRFSRPLGSSSRGGQADPKATESDSDVDGGAPAVQRGRQFLCCCMIFFFLFICSHSRTILFYSQNLRICSF
jgi:hypothetical protein